MIFLLSAYLKRTLNDVLTPIALKSLKYKGPNEWKIKSLLARRTLENIPIYEWQFIFFLRPVSFFALPFFLTIDS